MSRRASFFARQHPGQRRVRFPDEIVFDECIKEADGEMVINMLRRVSMEIDVNRINMAGMTALHQAVLDDNLPLVHLLVTHGADVHKADVDSWTPLHAAAANGHTDIVRYLMDRGADTQAVTEEGETALDLVDGDDYPTMAVLLDSEIKLLTEKNQKKLTDKKEPAWVRRESLQEQEKDTRRKGSAWVGKQDIPEEEEDTNLEGNSVTKVEKEKHKINVGKTSDVTEELVEEGKGR